MKRIVSIVMIITMLMCMLNVFGVVSFAKTPTGIIDLSGYSDGDKYIDSKGNEYTVLKSASTIVSLVTENMSGNYILGNDIDFGNKRFWSHIFKNDDQPSFSGIFDGNGYSITNFYTTANYNAKVGLVFGSVSGNAVIQNLSIGSENAKIQFSVPSANATDVGGLVGYTKSGARLTVSNVNVYADISCEAAVSQSVDVGGFIADCEPVTITDSNFYGSIKFTEAARVENKVTIVGGIVGRCTENDQTLNIINCKSYADIDVLQRPSTNDAVSTLAGGIIGSIKSAVNIRNCDNYGEIKGDRTAGGIAAKLTGLLESTYAFDFVGCRNYGDVSAQLYAGGILGVTSPSSTTNAGTKATYSVSILNCLNVADIAAKTTDEARLTGANSCSGGIVGKLYRGYNTIENCASVGNISCNGRTGAAASTAGGIYGYLYVNKDEARLSVIRNCYAIGTLAPYAANYNAYATGPMSMDKATIRPFVSNCYNGLTATMGTLLACPESLILTENYGDYEYVANASISSDEVANGTLLAKLGDEFAQTVGADDYPIPVCEKYTLDGGMENLFNAGSAGYYGDGGAWVEDNGYTTKNNIAVTAGDVITVGALSTDQASAGCLFDSNKALIKKLSVSDMTLVAALGNGYGIYSYTVTEGTAFVSITTFSRRAYITLLTLNDVFDENAYYDYFGIEAMKGSADSPLWRKSALFIGDSICYGHADVAINGRVRSYGGRVAYDYDMDWVNAGISGASISTVTSKVIANQLEPYKDQSFDYILINGGANDRGYEAPLGTITDGFNSSFNTSTFAGGLESLFKTITDTYPNAKVGFLIRAKSTKADSNETYLPYREMTINICEKWDVEYFDMYGNDEITNTVFNIVDSKSAYLPDGTHPNSEGYDRLYPYIASFMETLAVPVIDSGDPPADNPPTENPPADNPSDDTPNAPSADENDPQDTESLTTDTEGTVTNTDTQAPEENKKGCGSLLSAPLALVTALSLGVTVISKKKNKF